jgi:alpha-beta hydrolase superfamily lysophospholipase
MSRTGEKTATFTNASGKKIFYCHYPVDQPRGILVIAHGLGEHSGRYSNVVDYLWPKGFSIWALDHCGHGRSDGKRGHVLSFGEYLQDLGQLVEMASRERGQGRKLFVLGHSLGGLITVSFALNSPEYVDGYIVSSPALGMIIEVPMVKKILGNVMSSIWPGLQLANELEPSHISHDPAVVDAYVNDPLVHSKVSARWFTEFTGAMEKANRQAARIKTPILMQVAGDDKLVNAEASRAFFERLQVEDKTLKLYPGLYHEIYNEVDEQKSTVLADLEQWLTARL